MNKENSISKFVRRYGNVLVIIVLIIGFALINPAFLTVYNFTNIIRQIAMMGIVSVGFTFVMVGGGLDLSVGSQIAFMNICVATGLMPNTGLPLPFISYGVTSLVTLCMGVGIVINVGLQNNRYR